MIDGLLAPDTALVLSARPRRAVAAPRPVAWEWLVLLTCGATAAALSAATDFGLKVPGHAIVRAVVPFGLGLALVPRRGSGTTMAVSALATGAVLHFGPGWLGPGATTSAAVLGVFLDLALRVVHTGRGVWTAFVVAGLATNVVAFAVRLVGKLGGGGRQPIEAWWPTAAVSYPLCGALAGLLVAMAFFRLRQRDSA